MTQTFDLAFKYLLNDEGGYVNDPQDSGGPTNFGITQHTYEQYLNRQVLTNEIKEMPVDVAKKIYYENYWQTLEGDKIVDPVIAICLFDTAVLYGKGVSANLAQRAANICGGTLKIDGDLGDTSIATLNILKQEDFLKTFHGLVLARIDLVCAANPKNEKYRHGWTLRAARLLTLNTFVNQNIKLT